MNFAELVTARYSVRSFLDKPVEQEKLDLILRAVRRAPTAANRQPQRILVINESGQLAKVDRCTTCRFDAPLVFLVCYERKFAWVRDFDQEHSGWVDASIAAAHIVLQAADLGLGTTWVMWFDPAMVRTQFNLPADLTPVAFLPTGYAAPGTFPSDQHSDRLPLDKLVFYGSF
jgi:nitroreductase